MIQRVDTLNGRKSVPAHPLVQVAPRQFVQMDLLKIEGRAPETVFCDLEPVVGHPNHYRLVPRTLEHFVRLTPELVERLGLISPKGRRTSGLQTVKRLIRAGFVDGARIAPRVYTVNLASYFQHLKRCAENVDFWDDPKVAKAFNSAYF